eukprot:6586064-Karenia_brevis.AAC.1
MKFGGGVDAKYLRRTERLCRTSSTRMLPAEVFDALANVELPGLDQAVHFRHSILQTLYVSQHGVVNENECKA